MTNSTHKTRFWLWLIRVIGVIVPRRLRADWRQEWEAELRYRELLLAEWDNLNWRTKLDLLRRSIGAFWDALLLQPQRWEDEMFQDLRYGVRMLLHGLFILDGQMPMAVKASAGRAAYLRRAAAILVTLRKRSAEIAMLRKAAIT